MIYRPPNYSTLSLFFEEFPNFMNTIIIGSDELLVTGDFNFHIDNPLDRNAKKFNDTINTLGLTQLVQRATHESGHILDLIITRQDGKLVATEPKIDYFISDHAFIHCELSINKTSYISKAISYRLSNNINVDIFKNEILSGLSKLNLQQITTNTDLDNYVLCYNEALGLLLDKHAPIRTKIITIRPTVPWITKEIRNLKRSCRKYERKWRTISSMENRNTFKRARNLWRSALHSAKVTYYRDKIASCKNDQKKLFDIVKSLTKISPDHSRSNLTANGFSDYFTTKINNIRSELDSHSNSLTNDIFNAVDLEPLTSFTSLSTENIQQLLMKAPNKSSTLDPIPTWLTKKCAIQLLPYISVIVNSSLQLGYFPNILKKAIITPILKKHNLDITYSNHRPVSNLSFISKLIERAVMLQLSLHLDTHNIFPTLQSAYRPNHSTETALLKVTSDLLHNLNNQEISILVLLDLSSAFDTIDHSILLKRLHRDCGVSLVALNWFESYFKDRIQCVKFNNTCSGNTTIRYGVPQGSCLGPLLFSIYVAPLLKIMEREKIHAHGYSDDHQLYTCFKPTDNELNLTIQKIEKCISAVRKWMLGNKLKLNEAKTECIFIGNKTNLSKVNLPSLKIGNDLIEPVNSVRNLGAIFDSQMKLELHVNKICRNSLYHLRNIRRVRAYLDDSSVQKVVHAFISSNIDYCNSLLYRLPNDLISKIQLIQNTAIRIIFKLKKYDHITPSLRHLHWLPVKHRITFKICLIVFKALHYNKPIYIRNMLNIQLNNRYSLRRRGIILTIPPHQGKTRYGERAFEVCGPTLWNALPLQIREINNINFFKAELKTFLFQCHNT